MVSKLQDFLDIANDEVGYEEGSGNDNKYGEHFGRNYEPWCAFFICWCADQAGILTDSDDADCPYIPFTGSTSEMKRLYAKNRRDLSPSMNEANPNYPMPGDLVTIQPTGSSSESHIGIVYEVDGNTVTTIEGNISDKVKKVTYTDLVAPSYGTIVTLLSNNKSY